MAYTSFVDRSVASPLPKVGYNTMPNPRGLAALRNVVPSVASTEVASPATRGVLGFVPKVRGALSSGMKFIKSPMAAGLGAAYEVLKAKPLNEGEDDKLRELGILPPLPTQNKVAAIQPKPETNSITPIPPIDEHGAALVGGNRINYGDIGNPLKDAALINSKGYSFGIAPSETVGSTNAGVNQGGTNLENLLKTIQSVQPVQDYANRVGALNTGNTTWDMDSLGKILAAKAGHQADAERYQQQVGALANLGSAQMNAEAAKAGHESVLRGEREKIAAMAPYYGSEAQKNIAQAQAAPLAAKADVLKALTEQSKDNPILKASLETLKAFADRGDAQGYNDYAAKIAILTGKIIPKMLVQD